jgi:uncharacterized protein (TIGR02246 family)
MTLRIACAVVGVCLSAAALRAQTFQAPPADSQAISDLIALHADASQHGDFDRLIRGYQADADVRYSDGSVFRGLAQIKPRIHEILAGGPTSMAHAHPPATIHIRFLRPDVAFVDVESVFGGGNDAAGASIPPTRVPFFLVFTKVDGRWGVAVERSGVPLK